MNYAPDELHVPLVTKMMLPEFGIIRQKINAILAKYRIFSKQKKRDFRNYEFF